MKHNVIMLTIVAVALAALLLGGCATTPEPAETGEPVAVPATPEVDDAPVAPEEDVVDNTGEVTVGFTEDGYPFKGAPDAPVVIEEFSSYQCPYCARYVQETYPHVVANYVETGKVKYVFRDYPLEGQRQSQLAAEAALCAGEIEGAEAFWEMHDLLFANQQVWSGQNDADEIFTGYAEDLGVERDAFTACLEDGTMAERVRASAAEGSRRGVRGTPTFFINGTPLVGAQPYGILSQTIDQALTGGEVTVNQTLEEPFVTPTPVAIEPVEEARVLGDPDAPVTIVEFSDYQCPYCARYFAQTWPQIESQLVETGRVRYVFKDFPLTQIHPEAPLAHQAARCAGEQNAYWEMHDLLFEQQATWSEAADPTEAFIELAGELDVNGEEFAACLESGRWADAVTDEVNEGLALGVSGTPTFFINGYPIVGAREYELFEYAVSLAEEGKLGDAYRPEE